jgi:hypothetical protein
MKTTPVWIVTWSVSEGGWGYTSFVDEVYLDEKKAEKRCSELGSTTSEYCGYYYHVKEGELFK